ncbi:MAG TPA: glycosyltransferase 61 family protein, partial [Opitutus sp.]|nr:glycosyltransferase 61 family protein [Opitutus sp.]
MSPRQVAKALRFHARQARIRALAAPRHFPWIRRRLHLPANETFEPLADATPSHVTIQLLDPAESFRRPRPILPDAPAAARRFFEDRIIDECPPRYVAEFHGGLAWGHPTGGVFTADGIFVPALAHDPSGARLHTAWTRLRFPAPVDLPGRTLYLVTPEAANNYHHWLIDLLPRIGLVRRAGYDLAAFDHVIVNFSRRPYQLATLARLGLAEDQLIPANEALFVRADSLVVPSLKPNPQSLPAGDVAFLRETFVPPPPRRGAPRRRIFLSRSDASFRRLRDTGGIQALARAYGYEIVSSGDLDFAAQVSLFARAESVAGPAGAAFANLVFARAPVNVVEISPPGWLTIFHWMISARLDLAHTIL